MKQRHDCVHVYLPIWFRAGRLVIEVFEELIPVAAQHFINCCRPGMRDSLQGSRIQRILPDLAFFGGSADG